MKPKLIFITIGLSILGVGGLIYSYFIHDSFFQSVIISLSCSFFQLFLGLVIVNIYLDRKSKEGAIHSILILSNSNISKFHNRLLDLMWTKFGQNEFGELIKEYVNANGKPEVISPDKRDKIYQLIKNNHTEIVTLVTDLDSTFTEMSRLIGWDLDADLLSYTISSRNSIREFLNYMPDDDDNSKLKLVEYLLDVEYNVFSANEILKRLANIKDE